MRRVILGTFSVRACHRMTFPPQGGGARTERLSAQHRPPIPSLLMRNRTMFEVTCPKCQTASTAADLQGGEVIACSRCGQKLRVLLEGPAVAAPPMPGGLPTPSVADAAPPNSGGGLLFGLAGIGGLGAAAVILVTWFFMSQETDEKKPSEGDKLVAAAPSPPDPAKDAAKPPEASSPADSGPGGKP